MSEEINSRQLGYIENLVRVFKHSLIQIGTLNQKVKASFSPIRICVKKCTSELEQVSNFIDNEQMAVNELNEKYLSSDVFPCFIASFQNRLEYQEFLILLNERLDTYQKDVKQTKSAMQEICGLPFYMNSDAYNNKPTCSNELNVERINERLVLLENSLRQLQSGIKARTAKEEDSALMNKNTAINFRNELIAVLENIHEKSQRQLALTEQTLGNLKELSTYLQFEDIIGQKLEHITKILNLIIGGLEEKQAKQSLEDSPYFTLIPELSALTISHLNLVQEEYHTVINAVLKNASSVKGNLEQIGDATTSALTDIELKLSAINDIYRSLEAFLTSLFESGKVEKKISATFESYITAVLDNTKSVIDQIRFAQSKEEDCSNQLLAIQETVRQIHNSIAESLDQKRHTEGNLFSSINKFRNALATFDSLSQKVILKDTDQRLKLNQKTMLSASLSNQIEGNLSQLGNNNLMDQIINDCKEGLIEFAQRVGGRKLSEKEVDTYQRLKEIYSMDSERMVHESNMREIGIGSSGTEEDHNQNKGTIELF